MSKIAVAIYGIQRDDNGKYYLDDKFAAENLTFDSLGELISYLENDLKEIEDDIENGRLDNEKV